MILGEPTELHKRLATARMFGGGRMGWNAAPAAGSYDSNEYVMRDMQGDHGRPLTQAMRNAIGEVLQALDVHAYRFQSTLNGRREMLYIARRDYEKLIAPHLGNFDAGSLLYTPPDELLLTDRVEGLLTQRIRETLFHAPGDCWDVAANARGEKEYRLAIPSAHFDIGVAYTIDELNELGAALMKQDFGIEDGFRVREADGTLQFTLSLPLVERFREIEERVGPEYLVGDVQYMAELQNKPTQGANR